MVYNSESPVVVEGLMPIAVGILTFFALPSYPDRAKWLSSEERDVIIKHLHHDAPKVGGKTWSWYVFLPEQLLLNTYPYARSALKLLFSDPTFYCFTYVS